MKFNLHYKTFTKRSTEQSSYCYTVYIYLGSIAINELFCKLLFGSFVMTIQCFYKPSDHSQAR